MTPSQERASRLALAYEKCIEAEHALLSANLHALARDVREIRNLTWAELLGLYINSPEPEVREYLHTLGVGDRLLEDARLILRSEGERRRLDGIEADSQQVLERAEPLLWNGEGDSVPEVGSGGLEFFERRPTGNAELVR